MTQFTESEMEFAEYVLRSVQNEQETNDYQDGDTSEFSSTFDGATIPANMRAARKILNKNGYCAMFEIRDERVINLVIHW